MNKEKYEESLLEMLPNHSEDIQQNFDYKQKQANYAESAAEEKQNKLNASQVARLKLKEKRELEKIERRKTDPKYGMTQRELKKYEAEQERIQENIAELEVIEESPEVQEFLSGGFSDVSPYAGTTKRDVVKLLDSLNINLSVNLSRSDTYNMLSCLLTCNEGQLNALMANKKVPIAIKTVIKRLLEDSKLGNIETVERLWDRIFGKADKVSLDMPQVPTSQGIIPNTVVSREAYLIIRDTLIGK